MSLSIRKIAAYLLPICSGFLQFASFPLPAKGYLAWVAFVPLLAFVLMGRGVRRSLLGGSLAGFVSLALILYWIPGVLSQYGGVHAALAWILFILLAAVILGSLYSLYLRDKVGYLTLPPIEGLIFLCGWACLSPDTLFSTALPWYLYLLGLVWQSGHILAHYVLNIRFDEQGKPNIMTPAFLSKPSLQSASRMTMGCAILLLIMSVLLPVLTPLSFLYSVPVAAYGIYTLYQCLAFIKSAENKENMHRAWSSLSIFRMVISAAISLSILVFH